MLLRILLYALIIGAIYFGIRRILKDWREKFAADDAARRQRDLDERKRPDVVELKKDKDGVFRPGPRDRDRKEK